MTWRGIVGKSFTPEAFEKYVAGLKFGVWRPRFIVVHNTSAPDTATWRNWQARKPPVTDEKWAQNLVGYYRDQQHWSAGPHLFVTPGGILVFSPLTGPGTHSPAWNSITWGVETVGEFEHDAFDGPIKSNLVAALAILHAAAGLQPEPYERGVRGLHFHKEDPVTTHKSCPGKHMVKADLVAAVEAEILRRHGGGGHPHTLMSDPGEVPIGDADEHDEPQQSIVWSGGNPQVVGDPDLWSVQQRLGAMNYAAGISSGVWGGMTAGALSAFINDRGGHIPAPTSLDMFDANITQIKRELASAEAEGFKRPVTAARKAGDAATVAKVAPEVLPAKRSAAAALWGSITLFFTSFWNTLSGYASWLWGLFTDHKDDIPTDPGMLQTAWEYLGRVPTPVWLALGGVALAVVWIDARKGVNKIVESVQSGARQ